MRESDLSVEWIDGEAVMAAEVSCLVDGILGDAKKLFVWAIIFIRGEGRRRHSWECSCQLHRMCKLYTGAFTMTLPEIGASCTRRMPYCECKPFSSELPFKRFYPDVPGALHPMHWKCKTCEIQARWRLNGRNVRCGTEVSVHMVC